MVLSVDVRDKLRGMHHERLGILRDWSEQNANEAFTAVDGLDDAALSGLIERWSASQGALRQAVADEVDAYLSMALDIDAAGLDAVSYLSMLTPDQLATAAMLRARGTVALQGFEMALEAGMSTLSASARGDVGHVAQRAIRDRISRPDAARLVTGTRRIPEGRTCGFCVAASSQIYHARYLHRLHNRCDCNFDIVTIDDNGDDLVAPYLDDYKAIKRANDNRTGKGTLSHKYADIAE